MTDDLAAAVARLRNLCAFRETHLAGQGDIEEVLAALEERPPDDPDMDATDAAHPAWWRGQEHGTLMTAKRFAKTLSGEDTGGGKMHPEMEKVRRGILDLRAELEEAQREKKETAHAASGTVVAAIARAEKAERELSDLTESHYEAMQQIPGEFMPVDTPRSGIVALIDALDETRSVLKDGMRLVDMMYDVASNVTDEHAERVDRWNNRVREVLK